MKSLVFTFVALSIILCGISCDTFMNTLDKVKVKLGRSARVFNEELYKIFNDPKFIQKSRAKFLEISTSINYVLFYCDVPKSDSISDRTFLEIYHSFERRTMIPQFEFIKYIVKKYGSQDPNLPVEPRSSDHDDARQTIFTPHEEYELELYNKLKNSKDFEPLLNSLIERSSFGEIMSEYTQPGSNYEWKTRKVRSEPEQKAMRSNLEKETKDLCDLNQIHPFTRSNRLDYGKKVFFARSNKKADDIIPIYEFVYFIHHINEKLAKKDLKPMRYVPDIVKPELNMGMFIDKRCRKVDLCECELIKKFDWTQEEVEAYNLELTTDDTNLLATYDIQTHSWEYRYPDLRALSKSYEPLSDMITHLKNCNMALLDQYVSKNGESGKSYPKACSVEKMDYLGCPILSLCSIIFGIIGLAALFEKKELAIQFELNGDLEKCKLFFIGKKAQDGGKPIQKYDKIYCDIFSMGANNFNEKYVSSWEHRKRLKKLIENIIEKFFNYEEFIKSEHREFLNDKELCESGCVLTKPVFLDQLVDYFKAMLKKDDESLDAGETGHVQGKFEALTYDKLITTFKNLMEKDPQMIMLRDGRWDAIKSISACLKNFCIIKSIEPYV